MAAGLAAGNIVEIDNLLTAYLPTNALRTITTFTATAAQTTFSVSYTQGLIDVFYNGSNLAQSEYTATNGTSIILATACQVNDIVVVYAYSYSVGAYSGIGGSGTATQVAYFTSSAAISSSSNLYWDNTNTRLGIGNSSPSYTLDVSGSLRSTTSAYFATASGSVGIGTVSPSDKFSVDAGAGNVVTSSFFNSTMTAGQSSYIEIGKNYSSTYNTGELAFKYVGDGSSSNIVSLGFYGAGNKLNVLGNGNVGINTTAPSVKLQVEDSSSTSLNILYLVNSSTAAVTTKQNNLSFRMTDTVGTRKNAFQLTAYSDSAGGNIENGGLIFSGRKADVDTEYMRITSAGWSKFSNTGTYSSPNGTFHQFNSDDVDDVTLQVYASSTSKTGNVLESVCARAAANTYSLFACYSGSSSLQFTIRGDGLIVGPGLISSHTTGSAANMYADPSNGAIYRSTSSLKYKKNVEDYSKGLDIVMQLRPVTYEGKNEIDEGKIFAGFIAEEIHDLGLTEFVQYAEDGSPDALAYANMIALLTKAIQEQNQTIQNLQEQINAK
jgi:hypothetical protein